MSDTIAKRLKELREKNQISQADLAKLLSITRSSVNAWEMGISIPATNKIIELAAILHSTADYILGIDDTESINLKNLSFDEKEIIYHLMRYFEQKDSKSKDL